MDQEIQEVAKSVLPHVDQFAEQLLVYLQSGVNFAQEQAPFFVEEILQWGIFRNFTLASILLIPLILYLCISRYSYHKFVTSHEEKHKSIYWPDYWAPVGILGIIPLVTTVASFCFILEGLKALIAPRLYLIDYLSKLIK